MTGLAVRLEEWSTEQAKPGSPLVGLALSPGARQVADELTSSGRLEILEFAQGLEIRTTSWVGRIVLDDLTITVEPKIKGMPLLNLLRYAYNLRDLKIFELTNYGDAPGTFQDLILQQLAAEAEDIIYRGLHREPIQMEARRCETALRR